MNPTPIDLLIDNGTVFTLDPQRRVLDNASVAVDGDRIVAVGDAAEMRARYAPRQTINAHRKAVLPGLIDSHAHAGHGMLRTMGTGGDAGAWMKAAAQVYTEASDEHFWHAEAALASLEKLKAGVTTGVSLFGGGDSIMRVDDPKYARAHGDAIEQAGTRAVLAVGPSRPPAPRRYTDWAAQPPRDSEIDAETMMAVCEQIVRDNHGRAGGRLQIAINLAVFAPMHEAGHEALRAQFERQAVDGAALAQRHGLGLTQDGHRAGTIALARELGLLGPRAYMSHSIDLTEADMDAARETGTSIVHNPSAIMSIKGRCPVPELIERGVNVVLGSDGSAPDRGYDMFRHMFQAMHYHRRHFRDPDVLPHGKVLEMCTIDAAKALGLADQIGSLEVGKKADIILVDLFKPHMMPLNMPLTRVTCFANAADVDTTIVDGRVLMQGRRVLSVDEAEVLEQAQVACDRMLERSGLRHLTEMPARTWGRAHY
ncbi:MAG TPA: amidohydrolase family protein [Burkholderiaceae bacterium]|nr:amidohydrolase family protein [Burkholderiaceae bacterium]